MHWHIRAKQLKDDADDEGRHRGVHGTLKRSVSDLLTPRVTRGLFLTTEVMLLLGALGATVWLSGAQEWHPVLLVGLLLALALIGDQFTVATRSGVLSASLVALVLAMSLLGPGPAVAIGIAAMVLTSSLRRLPPARWLNNLATFAVFPLVGGLMVRALIGNVHDPRNQHLTQSVTFGLIVFGVFLVTVGLNFGLVALDVRLDEGRSVVRQVREVFLPTLPGELATGALATILAVAYTNAGLPVLFGAVAVLLIFQYLTVALLRSEDRADQLEARTIHLTSLQLGVLRTLVEILALRDRTTARHAAAVALYARELARELGSDETEQDLVHTAGLLHDIGKFALPDSILHAKVLSDEDWAVIRRHPQDGATLVGRLDGYGPVADAILYHHERMDGGGYPAGLIGTEIPLGSRILAICSIYDTMTVGRAYRPPMTSQEAMAELRGAAGHGQLDAQLVESFIGMLEREGPTFAEGQRADFETELAFEERVRKMAQPSVR